MNYSKKQAKHYDISPVLSPWPDILSRKGLKILYKPRELFLKKEIDKLNINKNDLVLDIGCGQGIFTKRIFNEYFCDIKGIDISDNSILYANNNYSSSNLNFIKMNAEKLTFKDNAFNKIICFDVLEHLDNQEKAIKEMVRVLKPGGKIFIYTLNKNDKYTLDWFWEKIGIDIYKRAKHKRELFVDPKKIISLFERNEMKVEIIEYYGGFFTIGLDEAIMVFIYLFKKTGLFKYSLLGKIILAIFNIISRIFYPILNFLDQPWYKRHNSLGFLVIANKL